MKIFKYISSTLLFLGMSVMSFSQPSHLVDPGGSSFFETTTTPSVVLGSVITLAVSDIMPKSAVANGNLTDLGGQESTAYGVCWNIEGAPTLEDNVVDNGSISETGVFEAELRNLNPNTAYYVRTYTINKAGTVYGDEVYFSTDVETGIAKQAVAQLKAYPNPFRNCISLTNASDIVNVQICDLSGTIVVNTQETENINLNYLSSGIYFMKCEKNNHQVEIVNIVRE